MGVAIGKKQEGVLKEYDGIYGFPHGHMIQREIRRFGSITISYQIIDKKL